MRAQVLQVWPRVSEKGQNEPRQLHTDSHAARLLQVGLEDLLDLVVK